MTTEKGPSGSVKFECKMCEYSTSKQSQYDRHNLTAKHINATKCYKNTTIKDPKMYECNCGNKYKHHSSLWTHKKKCKEEPKKEEEKEEDIKSNMGLIMGILKQNQTMLEKNTSENNDSSLIIELLKQNQGFKELMIEQNKYMLELAKKRRE